jgi:hypothetical protein
MLAKDPVFWDPEHCLYTLGFRSSLFTLLPHVPQVPSGWFRETEVSDTQWVCFTSEEPGVKKMLILQSILPANLVNLPFDLKGSSILIYLYSRNKSSLCPKKDIISIVQCCMILKYPWKYRANKNCQCLLLGKCTAMLKVHEELSIKPLVLMF